MRGRSSHIGQAACGPIREANCAPTPEPSRSRSAPNGSALGAADSNSAVMARRISRLKIAIPSPLRPSDSMPEWYKHKPRLARSASRRLISFT
jgi:hypothetical protein